MTLPAMVTWPAFFCARQSALTRGCSPSTQPNVKVVTKGSIWSQSGAARHRCSKIEHATTRDFAMENACVYSVRQRCDDPVRPRYLCLRRYKPLPMFPGIDICKLAPRDGYKTRQFIGFYRARMNETKKYPLNCPHLLSADRASRPPRYKINGVETVRLLP